jgi:hypothetical protein
LANEAVEPLVTWAAKVLGRCLQAAVAHADQQLQDKAFKELRRPGQDPRQQIPGDGQ